MKINDHTLNLNGVKLTSGIYNAEAKVVVNSRGEASIYVEIGDKEFPVDNTNNTDKLYCSCGRQLRYSIEYRHEMCAHCMTNLMRCECNNKLIYLFELTSGYCKACIHKQAYGG